MNRSTINRIRRLESTERSTSFQAVIVTATDRADAERQLAELAEAGRYTGREPTIILTGAPRP
jgi:hypothetical protein